MKIVLAPDKFKGSLGAAEVAAALARGLRRACPEAELVSLPISDGGEGFVAALAEQLISVRVSDALGRPVTAEYGLRNGGATAIIEMSAASGLWRLEASEYDPLRSSTFGTGQLIIDALKRGAREILIGIGGSATNDGGAGMAEALGYRFWDEEGNPMKPLPIHLLRLGSVEPPARASWPRIVAACDVANPLLGPLGATRVYSPQKGANAADLDLLERALERLADVVTRDLGRDFRAVPGAGAAGGLGFGLMSFCGAEVRSGFELVAEFLNIEEAIATCDLVVTGEGKIDAQTFHGKGPAGVAALARGHGKTVIAFAGIHESGADPEPQGTFDAVIPISGPGTPVAESIKYAASLLEDAAADIGRYLPPGFAQPSTSAPGGA